MSSSSSNLKLSYLHWLRKRKINRPTITLFSLSMPLSNIALDKSAHEKSLSYWNIFWLKLTKWRIIPYQVEDKAFTPLGLETFASITQSDTIYPGTLKMMLHETIRNDDFQINKALQHCCDIVSNSYNIVPKWQRCFALKIVVANRPE